MDLEELFERKRIIKLKSTEKQLIIKELVDKLQDLEMITNKERYYAQVIHRESLENTGIGNGLAIPHARTESVSDLISIFGILDKPIDYQSMDEKPVKYVLLSIFPTEMSTKYLYLIGMMARLFSHKEKRKMIDSEPTPAKLYSLLKKEAKSYFASISTKDKPAARIETAGITLVLNTDQIGPNDQKNLRAMDIDPAKFTMVVCKGGFAFRPQYPESMYAYIMSNTPGFASVDLKSFTWTQIPRPIYPLDDI